MRLFMLYFMHKNNPALCQIISPLTNNLPLHIMIKYLISFLIILNTSALTWCGFNYATLSSVSTQDAIFKINKMSDLANESLQTINNYSEKYKKDHINEIISHYKSLTEHLESTKDMTIEVTDVLFR